VEGKGRGEKGKARVERGREGRVVLLQLGSLGPPVDKV